MTNLKETRNLERKGLSQRTNRAYPLELSGVKLGKICGDESPHIVLMRQRYTSYNPNLKIGDFVLIHDDRANSKYIGVIVSESNVSMYEDEYSIRASIAHHDDITHTERDIYIAKEWRIKLIAKLSSGKVLPPDQVPYRLSDVTYLPIDTWKQFLGDLLISDDKQDSWHLGDLEVGSKILPLKITLPKHRIGDRLAIFIGMRELLSETLPSISLISSLKKLGYALTPILTVKDMVDTLGGLRKLLNESGGTITPGAMIKDSIPILLYSELSDDFNRLRILSSYSSLIIVLTDSVDLNRVLLSTFNTKIFFKGASVNLQEIYGTDIPTHILHLKDSNLILDAFGFPMKLNFSSLLSDMMLDS